jgi:hypothetical protein
MERLFTGIAGWKAERRELMLALVEVWYSDDNVLVRDKVRRSTSGVRCADALRDHRAGEESRA